MHKYAIGAPSLSIAPEIDSCSIYLKAKPTSLPLLPAKYPNAIKALLSILDLSSEHVRRLSGLHGEKSYVILRDYFSHSLYGAALHSKANPIEWHLQLS
jgi:hypothetical protein